MTSSTILNNSGENEYPCLIPDLRDKIFSYFLVSIMLTVGLSYMTIIMLEYISSIPNYSSIFITKASGILSNFFFCIY